MTNVDAKLRAETRSHLEIEGLSMAKAARSIGMSTTAISAWLRGIYHGDNERVATVVERWLETERVLAKGRPRGCGRHASLGVTIEIENLAAHAQANRDIVLLYGAPGTGKSYALQRYCEDRSSAWYTEASPVLKTPTSILRWMAHAIGFGEGAASATRLDHLLVDELRGRDALVVIDESHFLAVELLEVIRSIYDRARCGLVLSGNDPLRATLKATGRAGQLLSRIGVSRRLRSLSPSDALCLAETLLQREPQEKGRDAVLAASRNLGALRAVVKLVSLAEIFARSDGREDIRDEDLAEAAAAMKVDE